MNKKIENLDTKDCIRTFTGVYVNVFEPDINTINIYDIAHALAFQGRFTGHLPRFYSVAQHSIMCSKRVEPKYKLQALMHDASEAYLTDMPSPIKNRMPQYREVEDKLMGVISEIFNFEYPLHPSVKEADRGELEREWHCLMLNNDEWFECWTPQRAKEEFLDEYFQLAF